MYNDMSKVSENAKKFPYNQLKPYSLQKTTVKPLPEKSQHILHQDTRNCPYFACSSAHHVYMSGFYLYIIFFSMIFFF
jgi:hypothetical protein